MVAQFFCGMASVTANSRMSYAFSPDNALPGSRIWKKVNPPHRYADQLDLALRVCPSCWPAGAENLTAYFAATSIAVIGLYIAYICRSCCAG